MQVFFALCGLLASTALGQSDASHNRAIPGIFRRQAINPSDKSGSSCSSFGPEYIACGSGYCYDPAIEICCGADAAGWSCEKGFFCFVTEYCCPNGSDEDTCAADLGVTLTPTQQATVSPIATPPFDPTTIGPADPIATDAAPPTKTSSVGDGNIVTSSSQRPTNTSRSLGTRNARENIVLAGCVASLAVFFLGVSGLGF